MTPLEHLEPFDSNGRAYRAFDHVICARDGAVLMVPLINVDGDLRRLVDRCPVPYEDCLSMLDEPEAAPQQPALSFVAESGFHLAMHVFGPGWAVGMTMQQRAWLFLHPVSGAKLAISRELEARQVQGVMA